MKCWKRDRKCVHWCPSVSVCVRCLFCGIWDLGFVGFVGFVVVRLSFVFLARAHQPTGRHNLLWQRAYDTTESSEQRVRAVSGEQSRTQSRNRHPPKSHKSTNPQIPQIPQIRQPNPATERSTTAQDREKSFYSRTPCGILISKCCGVYVGVCVVS